MPVLYEGEADDVGYLITKDTGARVRTSVSQHLKFIRTRKKRNPHDFAQLVRFSKWWVRQLKEKDPDFRFKSFMIELIWATSPTRGLQPQRLPGGPRTFLRLHRQVEA